LLRGFAQTITLGTLDPGPYSPGSSITVPITVVGPCVGAGITYSLFLSDATGSFATKTAIGTFNSFYATYVNGTIPTGLTVTGNYRLRVETNEATPTVSGTDVALPLANGPILKAAINAATAGPGVFGNCNNKDNTTFNFLYANASTAGTTGTVKLYNELNAADITTLNTLAGNFTAQLTNYTVIVRVTNGITVATNAYILINNPVKNGITSFASTSACIANGGGASITYRIPLTDIENNFRGDLYRVNWGDNSTTYYTYCQLKLSGGDINHVYTTPSCGLLNTQGNNVYQIEVRPTVNNMTCSELGTVVLSQAAITLAPQNDFTGPMKGLNLVACENKSVTFKNNSYPGQDPQTGNCVNLKARYTWYVDGAPIVFDYEHDKDFVYTFTTAGVHKITLELQSNTAQCGSVTIDKNICIQATPNPVFTLPAAICIPAGGNTVVTPTYNNAVDNSCFPNGFKWTVTGGTVGYTGGTSSTSEIPQFVFSANGNYTVRLTITDACGEDVTSHPVQIAVNSVPVINITGPATYCGPQILKFDDTPGSKTRISFSGTIVEQPTTYTWTVTGGTSTFKNGTDLHSKNPQIEFSDFANYTVSVTHQNNCGTTTKTQQINILEAPTVSAGGDATTCIAPTYQLTGTVGGNTTTVQSYVWTVISGGDGVLTNETTLTPIYTLGTNDKLNGAAVKFQLLVTTSLNAPCNNVISQVTITFPAPAKGTNTTQTVCSGTTLNHAITNSTGTTFTWTANSTSAFITGYTSQNTAISTPIKDPLINNNATQSGDVVYTITPYVNGCTGIPFTYTVTVNPVPTVTATPPAAPICSNTQTNIVLTPAIAGTRYTWTAVPSANISGSSNTNTPTTITPVNGVITFNQTLVNNSTTQGTVTYVFTPIGAAPGSCPGPPTPSVVITVNPHTTAANAGPNETVCNQTAYTLKGNVPAVGIGKWTVTPAAGVTFSDDTKNNAVASGLVAGQAYDFTWTITSVCGASAPSTVKITNTPPPVGGITAGAVTVCATSNNGDVTVSGITGTVDNWELSTDGGTTWQTIAGVNKNTTYHYNQLQQTTMFRAAVINGVCTTPAVSTPVTITVTQPPAISAPGPAQTLCNQGTVILAGNTPPPGTTAKWTLSSGQTGITFDDDTKPNAVASNLVGGQVYIFTWTFDSNSACGVSAKTVTITNQSAIVNTINVTNATVCPGSNISITNVTVSGGTTTGVPATYSYIWERSTDGGVTWNVITNQTGSTLNNVPILQTTKYRRMVYSAGQACNGVSNEITINTEPPVTNNTIQGTTPTICGNVAPAQITGSQPTGGDGTNNYIYRWQQSKDNGVTFADIPGATQKDYTPPILTGKVIFRRLASTALCAGTFGSTSNTYTIVTNPDVVASFTATNQIACAPFVITNTNIHAVPDPNAAEYIWYADDVEIGRGLSFPGYTITPEGKKVTIKLTVTSALGCLSNSTELEFTTIKLAFAITSNSGCGPVTITNFGNQSIPNNIKYTWSFGDNTPDYVGYAPPPHTYQPDQFGNDKSYTITLKTDFCTTTLTAQLAVYPSKPTAVIDPGPPSGCSPYAITVRNFSLGTNQSYDFYLKDENGVQVQHVTKTDKSDAVFSAVATAVDVKIYHVYMVATGLCGATTTTGEFPIIIAPTGITARMTVTPLNNAGGSAGCAPFLVNFHNLSTGGTGYVYNIYDENFIPLPPPIINNDVNAIQNYSFTKPGIYYVKVGVFSNCASFLESAPIKITVYPVPTPDFSSDANTTSCKEMTVNFTNLTPGTPTQPATTMNYTWNFGDGTPNSQQFSPTHTFDYKGSPYTITLTAVNSNGCSNIVVKQSLIIVHPPPLSDFTAKPGLVTVIPDYTLSFLDISKGVPAKWSWDFGDKIKSSLQNPVHTYADTGSYTVKLVTSSAFGCTDSITRVVHITGVPGQLYLPNAFMPTSLSQELRTFTVKGSGIKSYTLQIFNNWGQLVFQTSKLNEKGQPTEFWDGRFKGEDAPQGVYAWQVSALFINGTEWKGMSYKGSAPKRAGTLTLIR
jgi:PKD repeat protein